ncbi:MAG: hypothetical protein QOJ91_2603 [Sphingomonadales bacterium]|nr:hypothetical protein [Sphingomonadales bacterium]
MSFLCRLGRHRPRGIPRWNDGFYFATCERCGCDLVRTAFQSWHVPSGYRIVWSDRPPADRPEVTLVSKTSPSAPEAPEALASASSAGPVPEAPEPVADDAPPPETESAEAVGEVSEAEAEPSVGDAKVAADADVAGAPSAAGRLPIQDVLAQLHAEDAAERNRETPPMPVEAPARRSNWDFMDEDPFPASPVPRLPSARFPERPPGPAESAPAAAPTASVDRRSRRVGGLPEKWRSARSAMRNFFSGPAEPNPPLVIGLALALAVALAAALVMYGAGSPSPGSAPPPGPAAAGTGEAADPFAADAPSLSAPEDRGGPRQASADSTSSRGDRAYVAASLLSCRDAPVRQARRVRNLARGQEVRILGIDGDWASLAYRGGQCWAQAQFISPVPPLR